MKKVQPTPIDMPIEKGGEPGHSEYFKKWTKMHDSTQEYLIRRAGIWKGMCIGCASMLVLAIGGLIYVSTLSKVEVYRVRIDSEFKTTIDQVKTEKFILKDEELKYFTTQFVNNLRTVSFDPAVQIKSFKAAFAFVAGAAKNNFKEYMPKTNLTKSSKNDEDLPQQQVTVGIKSVLRASPTSFQVQWAETTYEISGEKREDANYTGLFTYAMIDPKKPEEIQNNPIGLYFTDISINKDVTQPKK